MVSPKAAPTPSRYDPTSHLISHCAHHAHRRLQQRAGNDSFYDDDQHFHNDNDDDPDHDDHRSPV
jgi:hypothetical protein